MAKTDTVDVTLAHPWEDHRVGDRVSVAADEAKRLVKAGIGSYSTKKDAIAVEGDAGAEKTVGARKAT